jgi:hypothetical protein
VSETQAGADTRKRPITSASLRCNAPQTPLQRTPQFPKTPWGKLREATGWSLRELERRTRINAGVLSRIERGFGPTPDQARKLLAVYDGAR